LSKLPAEAKETQDLYTELCAAGSSLTSVHAARLNGLNAAENKNWNEILLTANKLIESVDQTELLAWLGTKSDTRENAGEVKKEMEKKKGQLIEAFAAKGDALLKIGGERKNEVAEVYSSVVKYTDPYDSKVIGFVINYLKDLQLYAGAFEYVVKQVEEKNTKEIVLHIVELLNKLEWKHAARLLESGVPAKFPAEYQPF